MTIRIDADGCPVVDLTICLARQYHLPCQILCDTSHFFSRDGAETLVCDKGTDSVDFTLVNLVQKGDLVVTQDYGLAAMCLSRGAIAVHQDGFCYTEENIDTLLESRALHRKLRASGRRMKGPPKRTKAQDEAFVQCMCRLLDNLTGGN